MALQAGLYKTQDQSEEDLTNGPGWTIDDQKPTTWSGFGLAPAVRGVGQGAAEGIDMLAHGLRSTVLPALMQANPFANLLAGQDSAGNVKLDNIPAWKPTAGTLEAAEDMTREYAKSLVADPRTTGTAANLLQGFTKAATEFTAGTVAGGPLAGATLLGASEGYGHYLDLKDQGVDDETAQKSGLLTAMTSGGSALLPMGMPARWLAGLSKPATMLAQMGAGVGINTSFGVANRYASAKILDDAGYHEMADQQKPWDTTNLLTDAITGAFFGAHAGYHTLKGAEEAGVSNIDPSIRDAAKVVQDRQAVLDGAPGVPVDMHSAAVNRTNLKTSLGDLLTNKPVDLSEIDQAGAAFAHADVDESAAAKIIRDAFKEHLDLEDPDAWMHGPENELPPTTPEPAVRQKPTTIEPPADVHPDAETVTQLARDRENEDGSVVAEQTPPALVDRPDLQIADETGQPVGAADARDQAIAEEDQANKEADPMHEAAVACEARYA